MLPRLEGVESTDGFARKAVQGLELDGEDLIVPIVSISRYKLAMPT